jgi:hypothetical protein
LPKVTYLPPYALGGQVKEKEKQNTRQSWNYWCAEFITAPAVFETESLANPNVQWLRGHIFHGIAKSYNGRIEHDLQGMNCRGQCDSSQDSRGRWLAENLVR